MSDNLSLDYSKQSLYLVIVPLRQITRLISRRHLSAACARPIPDETRLDPSALADVVDPENATDLPIDGRGHPNQLPYFRRHIQQSSRHRCRTATAFETQRPVSQENSESAESMDRACLIVRCPTFFAFNSPVSNRDVGLSEQEGAVREISAAPRAPQGEVWAGWTRSRGCGTARTAGRWRLRLQHKQPDRGVGGSIFEKEEQAEEGAAG